MSSVEIWKAVPGFEGRVEASSYGRVRKTSYVIRAGRGSGHLKHMAGRVVSPRGHPWGYEWVEFMVNGQRHAEFVHRLVAATFIGPCPPGYYVLHGDNNPANNRVENLRYGTPSENCADKLIHGTQPHGEAIPWSKLTEAQVVDMRTRRASGEKLATIASDYNLPELYVWQVTTGRKWRHAKGPITAKHRKVRRLTPEEQLEAMQLRGEGATISAIADKLGVSRNQVHNAVRGILPTIYADPTPYLEGGGS